AAKEKKDQQNLAKAHAKRSEKTLSPVPLHHAALENMEEHATIAPNDTTGNATNVEREVVNLSGNTRVSTSLATVNQPSPHLEHHNDHEHTASDAHSFRSSHHEDTKEGVADFWFVPNWGLCDDLRICTFRACKELVSHLATPAKEEFLGNLSNVEVVSRAYQSLGQCVLSQVISESEPGEMASKSSQAVLAPSFPISGSNHEQTPAEGHWFSFENKTGGRAKKCFKERHTDIDLRDEFPTNYNENDDARLAEFIAPLRPPPRYLLYVYGLTTAYKHPDWAYNIKDRDGNGIGFLTAKGGVVRGLGCSSLGMRSSLVMVVPVHTGSFKKVSVSITAKQNRQG
nr:hypothetical protein [Tanacetum cinerariifolium]